MKYSSGRTIMTQIIEGNYTNVSRLRSFITGAAVLDTSSAKPELRERKSLHLLSRFPMGTNVRPWLPRNWYRSPFKESNLWLIGLGVRQGTGPSMKEAESNSKMEANTLEHICVYTQKIFPFKKGREQSWPLSSDTSVVKRTPGRLRIDFQDSQIAFQRIIQWAEKTR